MDRRARPGTLSTSTPSSAMPATISRDLCSNNEKSVSKTGPSSLKEVKHILLSIQLDAIAALVDEQATRRLWKLFTNCAGSIAHGRRLENLSWRTWGRDQSVLRQQQQDQQRIEFHNNDIVHNEPILPSPQLLVTSMSTSKSETDAIESPSSPASNCTASVNPGSSITTRRRQSTSRTTSTSSPRPSYQRFDSNESTPAFASTPGSGSIAVSRSPPLGQLIKRVIFTPPDHSDDHKPALYVAATPDRPGEPSQLDSEDIGRTDAHHSLHQEVDNQGSQSTSTAAVTTPHIKLQSHVASTTSESLTSKSQAEGLLSTTCLPSRSGDELQPPQQRTASSTFPTVVISQSTPKPTPPDTPARCLSPNTFQALTPLHALSLAHALSPQTLPSSTQQSTSSPSPNSPNGSHHNFNQTPPTASSSSTISSYPVMSEIVTASRMPVEEELNNDVHSNSLSQAKSLLPNDTDTTAAAPVISLVNGSGVTKKAYDSPLPAFSNASRRSTSVGPSNAATANRLPISTQASQGPSHPRMFFLQRDSNSFSPESNSRSNSHSRSPASPTQTHRHRRHGSNSRFSDTRSPSQSRSPDPRNRTSVNPVTYQHNESQMGVKTTQGLHESGKNGTRQPSVSDSESRVRERVDQAVQINEESARQPSSSPHAPSAFSNRSQRLMARNRRSHRAYLGRALDRPSSRSRNGFKSSPGSVGSRNSGLAGSLDNNVGSASVSGIGSVSTSSSSRLVMGRLNRVHAPLEKETSRSTAQGAQQSPTSPLSRQAPSQPPSQVSPLATLPEPLRMEVLERQVLESNINRQSGGVQRRKIKLESDSEEDDDSFDEDEEEEEEEEEASEEENVQPPQRRVSSQEKEEQVVEDEDGSSWDDEDDVVVLPAKRTQTTAPPAPPPARRESHEQQQTGSDSSGRQRVHFPVQKAADHLQHVKSKTKLAQQQQHHRAVSPPPPARQQPARKAAAPHGTAAQAHARASQSSEGLLAQAAREAQRQKDLFRPLPRETYSSNNLVREKSLTSLVRGGRPSNLTLLLNPDPYWFPQGHPYRESPRDPTDPKLSRSMEEIYGRSSSATGMRSPARPGVGLGFGGLKMTSTNASPAPATRRDSAPAPAVSRTSANPSVAPSPVPEPKPRHSPNKTSKSPPAPSKLRASKSSMAVPVVLGVTASSAPRDEQKADTMEMSLRQMGARQQRQPRHPAEPTRPSIAQLPTHSSDKSKTSQESQQSNRGNRLGARPADVELSDSEDEEESSKSNDKGVSGRSLAQEHLAAVMDGKDPALVKAGLSASRSIVASPDAPPVDPSRQVESASYRPPAPPSSPSVYNAYEAKRAQGHLPHTPTPPSTTRPPTGRTNRPRPHSSHGQLLTAADPAPGPALPTPTRERRQPATSQPLVPVSIDATPAAAAPVPWPYNLPYPAPLQSPRTTRLKMLAAEVPDDLRKDLLWERKANRIAPILGNNGPMPIRRGANLKPLTTLRPEGSQPRDEPEESEEAMRERLQREREAKERYDKMRTRTWNGVIYQRPVW